MHTQVKKWSAHHYRDALELSLSGFRQKLPSYLIMALLVAFTVSGYLLVNAYWLDASAHSRSSVVGLNFPYIKATVVYAYLTNPPQPYDEFPPPRRYAPLFSEQELQRIRNIKGVSSLSIALCQETFSAYGHRELVSIEAGAPLWNEIHLVAGRFPESRWEILVPDSLPGARELVGKTMVLKKPRVVVPRPYYQDPTIKEIHDPEPVTETLVTGVYQPVSPMLSGYIGYLPVRRASSYPIPNPKEISMEWPVPNTIFLGLSDVAVADEVIFAWMNLYPDMPGASSPILPPPKVFWQPDLAERLVEQAASQATAPLSGNAFNAFILSAAGAFAAMFTAFLDRRRELGIMKTVGLENSYVAVAIGLEVGYAGILGLISGVAIARLAASNLIRGVSGSFLDIPWRLIAGGGAVAAVLLAASTFVPWAMARQGTAVELLNERPVPIIRRKI